MNPIQIRGIHEVPNKYYEIISGCYYDGYYYFLNKESTAITIYDSNLNYFTTINTNRIYINITYDSKEQVFLAYSPETNDKIYILNSNMEELGYIDIVDSNLNRYTFSSLSYNPINDSIIINIRGTLFEIDKEGNYIDKINCLKVIYPSLYQVNDYMVNLFNESLILYKNFNYLDSFILPNKFKFKSIIYGYSKSEGEIELYLLAVDPKNKYYIIYLNVKHHKYNVNNYNENPYCKPQKGKPGCCLPVICKDNAVSDLIESIALIETALSHILNAEGEKLQKAICLATDIKELIAVNESVDKTLTKVTMLETQLYSKLSTVIENCKDKNCKEKDCKVRSCRDKNCT